MQPLLDVSALSGACTNKHDIVDDQLAEIGSSATTVSIGEIEVGCRTVIAKMIKPRAKFTECDMSKWLKGFHYWAVKPSGNYAQDCDTGCGYAQMHLPFLKYKCGDHHARSHCSRYDRGRPRQEWHGPCCWLVRQSLAQKQNFR